MNLDWDTYKAEFSPGRGWLDVYVKNTGIADWYTLINFLRKTRASLELFIENQRVVLPDDITDILRDQQTQYRIAIHLDGLTLTSNRVSPKEIVLRLEPGLVNSEARARVVFRFMSTTARRLSKPVELVPDDDMARALFRYAPGEALVYLGS